MEKVLVIDSFGLIFRAYYAFIRRPLTTSNGKGVSAIFGFWKMVSKAIKAIEPDKVVFTFDSPGPSFRKEMYEPYKANREETPEDLKEQIVDVINTVKDNQFPYLMKSGLEADDVIAFFAKKFSKEEHEVYILSSDKDLAQLVHDHVFMAAPEKGVSELKILDKEGVYEKFGVHPSQIVDFLALTGDSSDNVPGVKGIGPKTAQKLLEEYEKLEAIYENIENIKSASYKKKLEACKDEAFLSKELVVLKDEIEDVNFDTENYHLKDEYFENLIDDFERYEFRLQRDDFFGRFYKSKKTGSPKKEQKAHDKDSLFYDGSDSGAEQKVKNLTNADYKLILKKEELLKLKEELSALKEFCLDTETTSENIMDAKLIGMSFCYQKEKAFYVPLFEGSPSDFNKEAFFDLFKGILESADIKKIGQNIKYDYQVLKPYVSLKGIGFDTMIAAYLLDPDGKKYNMDYLAIRYLNGYETISYKEIVGAGKTLLDVELDLVKDYACEDADITYRLFEILKPLLKKEEKSYELFKRIELPLISVLAEMELNGIALNIMELKELQVKLEDALFDTEETIYALAGTQFNLNSPKQVAEVLFDKMGIPPVRKTKTGYSTNEQVLEQLKNNYPIAAHLLDYRKYNKYLTTYVQTLPSYLRSGRIHSSFHQTGTATGRLSSSNPNLQNIPIRDEMGRNIRKAFCAKEGYSLVSVDYSQVELRLMAHFSEDKALIQAFLDDKDVHRSTASLVFNIEEAEVDTKQRTLAKSINFGIIYGMGAWKFSQETGISMQEGKEFIDRYFNVFQGVQDFIEEVKQKAKEKAYVETLFGHKRYLKNIRSRNKNLQKSDERMAVNTIIQGSNADILKKCMIKIFPLLKDYDADMLLQIHDELVFEVKDESLKNFEDFIKKEMENVVELKVPLKVSVASAKNWGTLK